MELDIMDMTVTCVARGRVAASWAQVLAAAADEEWAHKNDKGIVPQLSSLELSNDD